MTEGNLSEPTGSNVRERFEALMRQEGPRIYTLAVRLTGNLVDGQDLAAETFIRAYKSFSSFRGEAAFGTWVYRICINLWKNRVRSEKRRRFWSHLSLDFSREGEEAAMDLPSPEAPLEAPLEAGERRRLLETALDRLEPEERALVLMRDTDDKSYQEIASFLGVALGTVKSRLSRARLRLRSLLSPVLKDLT